MCISCKSGSGTVHLNRRFLDLSQKQSFSIPREISLRRMRETIDRIYEKKVLYVYYSTQCISVCYIC